METLQPTDFKDKYMVQHLSSPWPVLGNTPIIPAAALLTRGQWPIRLSDLKHLSTELTESPAFPESPKSTDSSEFTEFPEVTESSYLTEPLDLREVTLSREAMQHLDPKATVLRDIPTQRTSQFGQTQTVMDMDDGTDPRMLFHAASWRMLVLPAALLTVRRIPFHPPGLCTLVSPAALLTQATNHGQQGRVVIMDIQARNAHQV